MQKLPGLSDPGLGRVVCLFWCLFIFNLNADAQTPASNGVGELLKGLKTGEWKFYYPSGKLMAIEMYKEGMLHGKSTAYFPDGAIASVENWQDDLQEDSAW